MLGNRVLMAAVGVSGGLVVAAGLFGLIVGLGVISDLADRTHTGNKIHLYEDAVILGGIFGNIVYVYSVQISYSATWMALFGIFAGIFAGCWAMALTETLNVFPIFVRRGKLVKIASYMILSIAIGKGLGNIIYFWMGW